MVLAQQHHTVQTDEIALNDHLLLLVVIIPLMLEVFINNIYRNAAPTLSHLYYKDQLLNIVYGSSSLFMLNTQVSL